MLHDLSDLEPLHRQYDHEKVLVGPLFDLWTNSSFRVFNIAGKSSKIYETIGLGFFEVEMDAQRRRADIVAALEGRFGAVEICDSQLEMAQLAHRLGGKEERAGFWATVWGKSKQGRTRETLQKENWADPISTRGSRQATRLSQYWHATPHRSPSRCICAICPIPMHLRILERSPNLARI